MSNEIKIIEDLKELEAREGVFFGTDEALKDMQYNKARDLMVDIQLTDLEYDYESINDGNGEIMIIAVNKGKVRFSVCHEHKSYCIFTLRD